MSKIQDKDEKPILSWCSRCHMKFVPLGEVLVWGKLYPAMEVKKPNGQIEFLPETVEIVKALCEKCMIEFNSKKFDKDNQHDK